MVFTAFENAVAHTVAAFISIQRGFGRLPAGIPYCIFVLNVEIMSIGVIRNIVVTVTGHAEKFGVFIEAITSASVGN